MSLTLENVQRIALLARIDISPDEAAQTLTQLNNILGLIEQLQAANTDGIEPMSHAQDVVQRLRDDVALEPDRHHQYQQVAPQVESDLYLVPKVIE